MAQNQLLLAYRVIDIEKKAYIVIFPTPQKEEIEHSDFNYPKYIDRIINYLKELPEKDRIKKLNEWATPEIIEPYDILLGRIQIEYEEALKTENSKENLEDIYTPRMKRVIEEYKNSYEQFITFQKEETLKKKFEEIKSTSKERLSSCLNGITPITDLYSYDLRGLMRFKELRNFKRFFYANLDIGIQENLTDLELETMTLKELWKYNKAYAESKEQKKIKRKNK